MGLLVDIINGLAQWNLIPIEVKQSGRLFYDYYYDCFSLIIIEITTQFYPTVDASTVLSNSWRLLYSQVSQSP